MSTVGAGITRYDKRPCPHCGRPVDTAGTADGSDSRPPRSGDFMICFRCVEPTVVEVDAFGQVTLRKPTPVELAEFAVDHGHHTERLRGFWAKRGS